MKKKPKISKELRTPVFIRLLKEINITRNLLGIILVWFAWIPDLLKVLPKLDQDLNKKYIMELELLFRKRDRDKLFQVWFEILVCRAVDTFNTYLSDMLIVIFKSRPELLRSSEKVEIRQVFECVSLQEFTQLIIQRKVENLSYLNLDDLLEYFKDKIGLSLQISGTSLTKAKAAIAARNIVVHNHSIVNERYLRSAGAANLAIGDHLKFDFDMVEEFIENLENIAEHIDKHIIAKFGLTVFKVLSEVK